MDRVITEADTLACAINCTHLHLSQSFMEEPAMRRVLQLTILAVCLSTSVGCFLPIYSARPERRVQQLLFTSEDLRMIVDEWERFWFLDSPSHLTPLRTHGGII